MSQNSDLRGYVNPYAPGLAESSQREGMMGEIYTETRRGNVVDKLIQSVRKGSLIQVWELYCLAPSDRRPQYRRRLLVERIEAIKHRGGHIVELATGHKTTNGRLPTMLMRAYEAIATKGRHRPRDRMGRPVKHDLSKHEREVVEGIWRSRRYKNDDERVIAIEKRIGKRLKRGWLRTHLGSPHGRQNVADET